MVRPDPEDGRASGAPCQEDGGQDIQRSWLGPTGSCPCLGTGFLIVRFNSKEFDLKKGGLAKTAGVNSRRFMRKTAFILDQKRNYESKEPCEVG